MKELSMNHLIEMQKAINMLKSNVDTAINMKRHFIECGESVSRRDEALGERLFQPEPYYNCKLFDKGVELMKGGTRYNDSDGNLVMSGDSLKDYHIHCYHWIPQKLVKHNPSRAPDECGVYLATKNFDVAVRWFQKFVIEMFQQSGLDVMNFSATVLIEDKDLF